MDICKGVQADGNTVWLLVDQHFEVVEPVMKYLRYLESIRRSPNTIEAYARDLGLLWQFLEDRSLDWLSMNLEHLSKFVGWLKWSGNSNDHIPRRERRTESTINRILSTVTNFYHFHEQIGSCPQMSFASNGFAGFRRYKPLLAHAQQGKRRPKKTLKLKAIDRRPTSLSAAEVEELVAACNGRQEKLLLCLLYETGLRIGEALGLYHEDMVSGARNSVAVVSREHNNPRIRQKSFASRVLDVSTDLMRLYSQHLIEDYPQDVYSDYVFIDLSRPGSENPCPLSYSQVQSFFRRLERRTSIRVTPHVFRHTHATELLRAGWNIAYIQKRLGHRSIQTTINTYAHITDEDVADAVREFSGRQDRAKKEIFR